MNELEPEPEIFEKLPRIPAWLASFSVAKSEWKREGRILLDLGIFTVADVGNFSMRCFLAAKIQEMAVRNDPAELTKLKNLIGEWRQLGSLLGLDQASRARFKTSNPKKKSKAESFKARKKK